MCLPQRIYCLMFVDTVLFLRKPQLCVCVCVLYVYCKMLFLVIVFLVSFAYRKRKDLGEEFLVPPRSATPARMSEMPESEDGVRSYYEHPLTAATTAMLNLGSEDQASAMSFIYDYYNKIPTLVDKEKALGELWQ